MAHIDMGEKMMARIVEEIKEVGIIEQGAKLEGRFMTMVVAPKPESALENEKTEKIFPERWW
jgi:translation initiation factor IF-3